MFFFSCDESPPQVLVSYMKIFAVLFLAAAFTGCTTTTTTRTAQTDARQRELSEKRVHTREELEKTGRPQLAGALETVDAEVYPSSGGR